MDSVPITEDDIRAELKRELGNAILLGRQHVATLLRQHTELANFTGGKMAVLAVFAALREDNVL